MKKKAKPPQVDKSKDNRFPITNPCVICGDESPEGEIVCGQCQRKYGGAK